MSVTHAHTSKERQQPGSNSKHSLATHKKSVHKSAVLKDPVIPSKPPTNQSDENIVSSSPDAPDKDKVQPVDGKQAIGAKDEVVSNSANPSQGNEKNNKLRNSIIAVLFVIAFAAIGYGDYEHIKYAAAAKDDALRAAAGNSATSNSAPAKTSTNNTDAIPSQFMR